MDLHGRQKDMQLLSALKNDDQQAFRELYDLHWKDLYKSAYGRLRNQQRAEDLLQDLFTQIWEMRHSINIELSLKSYLHTALKNKIIRLLSRDDLHREAMNHLVYRLTEMQSTILDSLQASDLERTLSQTIATFPENMRKIFVLRSEDYSIREIAAALGLAEQTVRNNIAESLNRFRHVLDKRHPEFSGSITTILTVIFHFGGE